MAPLKHLSNFCRTFEMLLISCEINLILTWSKICIISNAASNQDTEFAITDTRLYVPVVTLSTQDNVKLLQQLKWGFKITINWNNYQSKVLTLAPMCFIEYLSYPIFHGVNRFFVLTFNINVNRFKHEKYCLPTKKTEDYKVMIDEKNTLGQPIKDDIKT